MNGEQQTDSCAWYVRRPVPSRTPSKQNNEASCCFLLRSFSVRTAQLSVTRFTRLALFKTRSLSTFVIKHLIVLELLLHEFIAPVQGCTRRTAVVCCYLCQRPAARPFRAIQLSERKLERCYHNSWIWQHQSFRLVYSHCEQNHAERIKADHPIEHLSCVDHFDGDGNAC